MLSPLGTLVTYGESGVPVQHILISLFQTSSGGIEQNTRTDEKGRYRFTGLIPGTYTVFSGEPLDRWIVDSIQRITLKKAESITNVDLRLVKGGLITGKVVDRETGRAVQPGTGSYITAPYSKPAPVNRDGTFRIRVSPREKVIRLSPQLPPWYPDGESGKVLDVRDGETISDIVFYVRKKELNSFIQGRVLTSEGEPVSEVRVRCFDKGLNDYVGTASTTDQDGNFKIYRVMMGQVVTLHTELHEKKLSGIVETIVNPHDSIEIILHSYETRNAKK